MAVRGDLGDGPACAEDPEHGRTYTMSPSKRLWCPVTQTIFAEATYDETLRTFVPGAVAREGQRVNDNAGAPVTTVGVKRGEYHRPAQSLPQEATV